MSNLTRIFAKSLLLVFSLVTLSGIGFHWVVNAQSDPPTHPDGWELTFGGDGQVDLTCQERSTTIWPSGIHIQQDDKILLFSQCADRLALLRFLPDGTPDTSLGVNGRVVISHTFLGTWKPPVTQSNNSILAVFGVGQVDVSARLVRYHANGELDQTFGAGGSTTIPIALEKLVVGADDQIIASNVFSLTRFTKNGVLDITFNHTGLLNISDILPPPNASASHWLKDIVVQPDGKLILSVYTGWTDGPFDQVTKRRTVIVRLNHDGSLDQSFATAGIYTVVLTTRNYDHPCDRYVALQADGRILAANPDTHQFIRLFPDGTLDSSFQTPSLCFDYLVTDRSGFILGHAGYWTNRLLPNGALDTSFAKNGQLDWNGGFNGFALQNDDSLVVVAGSTLMRNLKTKIHPSAPLPTPTPTLEPTPTPTATPLAPEQRSLALIYAVLDNNLGDDWTRLVNNVEAGIHPGVDVRMLVDGPLIGDAYVYTVQKDHNPYCPTAENPTCSGRYPEGLTFQKFFTEDTARPHALYQFLIDSLVAYPKAPQVTLTIVGHGSGWGANQLPAQPSIWRGQNDTLGGMLWDDHTGTQNGSRSLSTQALGQALHWATTERGRRLNLLYLDGCSMGMVEVAYELQNRADYLLASPNTDWATFAYDQLLPLQSISLNGRTLGERWLEIEARTLSSQKGYPFTLALTDLHQVGALSTSITSLANALETALPDQREPIKQAFAQSDRFDSNYDAKLDGKDTYIDLGDFVTQLQSVGITDTQVLSSAQQVQDMMGSLVITAVSLSGNPWVAEDQLWLWKNFSGLSLYAPISEDEVKRRVYYNSTNLAWALDTTWDEFLSSFWQGSASVARVEAEMPICQSTILGCAGLANPLPIQPAKPTYLPLIQKQ